jgi:hypothetical protein
VCDLAGTGTVMPVRRVAVGVPVDGRSGRARRGAAAADATQTHAASPAPNNLTGSRRVKLGARTPVRANTGSGGLPGGRVLVAPGQDAADEGVAARVQPSRARRRPWSRSMENRGARTRSTARVGPTDGPRSASRSQPEELVTGQLGSMWSGRYHSSGREVDAACSWVSGPARSLAWRPCRLP